MTGRYPIRYGRQYNVLRPNSMVGLSLQAKLLPQILREAGYATVHCGKWHLGDFDKAYWPTRRGFDHSYGIRLDQRGHVHHLITEADGMMRDEQPVPESGTLTQLITREAVTRIGQHDASKPLFLYLAYHSAHNPLDCPPEYSKPYGHLGPDRSVYAGMITEMDEGIGRVVAAIEKAGLRDNTLFIFASDNGDLATKTPAASTQPPDGRDIWPVLAEGKPTPHDLLLINTVAREGAVRAGDWKVVRNGTKATDDDEAAEKPKEARKQQRRSNRDAPDVIELFNVATDRAEKTNLASKQPEKVRKLLAKLDQFANAAVPPILKPRQENRQRGIHRASMAPTSNARTAIPLSQSASTTPDALAAAWERFIRVAMRRRAAMSRTSILRGTSTRVCAGVSAGI